MKRLKVGLNGFGRIGRAITRIAMDRDAFDLVLVNTRKTPNELMAYLLQYDSIYRKYSREVKATRDGLLVGDKLVRTTLNADASAIPWDEHEVDVVIDATGAYLKYEDLHHHFDFHSESHENKEGVAHDHDTIAQHHVKGTVKKVVLTAPAKDDTIPHIVLGVNDNTFDFTGSKIISNASCTTNCAAPMFKVLHDAFGVTSGYLTTAHAYTSTQSLLDDANKSIDRSRAAAINMSPSTTGAATAVVKVIPELTGKLDGMSLRIPVPIVSFTDVSAVVSRKVTVQEVNEAFRLAAEGPMKGYLVYETQALVSSDYIGSSASCTFDANYTKVIGGTLVKVFGWYDNEWGYSCRIVDLVEKIGKML
jgi:glyceraldehyde 3-phosphate dehydrogenase